MASFMIISIGVFAFVLNIFLAKKLREMQKQSDQKITPFTSRMTGGEVVASIFKLHDFKGKVAKAKSSHYNPMKDEVGLSPDVLNENSVADVAIAAHEAGHALQDSFLDRMTPVKILLAFVQGVCKLIMIPSALIGWIFGWHVLVTIGFWCLLVSVGISTVLAFLALFVEYDASRRAVSVIKKIKALQPFEIKEVKSVLGVAYGTYITHFCFQFCFALFLIM